MLLFLFTYNISNAQILKDCSSCSVSVIKAEQLSGLSVDEIRLLINEISARNGYRFDQPRFQEYFEAKSWYKPGSGKQISFNAVARKNMELLKQYMEKLKMDRSLLVSQLQKFKACVLAGNKKELEANFGFTYEADNSSGNEQKLLREVFSRISLTDINYYKRNGLNNVVTDNGFVKILYELSVAGSSVNLVYNYMSHSKIIGGFDQFNDYQSENEFMYNWQFNFKNGRLKFVRLAVAG